MALHARRRKHQEGFQGVPRFRRRDANSSDPRGRGPSGARQRRSMQL